MHPGELIQSGENRVNEFTSLAELGARRENRTK